MVVCDRCGGKVEHPKSKEQKCMTMYCAEGAYTNRYVDLCNDCLRKFENYIGKAQSYFMAETEKEPIDIINNVRYWNRGW